jgi:hypothetical protein
MDYAVNMLYSEVKGEDAHTDTYKQTARRFHTRTFIFKNLRTIQK